MIIDTRNILTKYENSTIEYKSLKKAIGAKADLLCALCGSLCGSGVESPLLKTPKQAESDDSVHQISLHKHFYIFLISLYYNEC